MKRTTLALFAATFLAATPAGAATIWALDVAGGLARIDTNSLRAMPAMAIKGTDGAVLSVALRPANGKLYGLTAKGQLVTIDPASGMASEVARLDKPMALGARTTINFNPLVDRLRVVSSNGGNWRVHPDTGAVIVDGGLKYAANSEIGRASCRERV